jgi:hypothetical protein
MVLLAYEASPPCPLMSAKEHRWRIMTVIVRATTMLQGQLPSCQPHFPGDPDLFFYHQQICLKRMVQKVFRFAKIIASLFPLRAG